MSAVYVEDPTVDVLKTLLALTSDGRASHGRRRVKRTNRESHPCHSIHDGADCIDWHLVVHALPVYLKDMWRDRPLCSPLQSTGNGQARFSIAVCPLQTPNRALSGEQ